MINSTLICFVCKYFLLKNSLELCRKYIHIFWWTIISYKQNRQISTICIKAIYHSFFFFQFLQWVCEEIINNLIQSAIDGTNLFFYSRLTKPMKSVEKSAHGYGLRPVCILYKYFCQKIVVLPYNICFEFISSYVLMQICTYIKITYVE